MVWMYDTVSPPDLEHKKSTQEGAVITNLFHRLI